MTAVQSIKLNVLYV